MDHSSHDMSSMSSSGGMFTSTDRRIAREFWYLVAACLALLIAIRVVSLMQIRQRLRQHRLNPRAVSARPTGSFSQVYATATATVRELVYPQPWYFTGRFTRYLTPLPLGRWLLLIAYWIAILSFLWTNTIIGPSSHLYPYRWERVGYRAAWVTITQIPFIFLLSCKFNPISILTGISYERFNWLHRWVARTVFLTAIVHWSFFYREWSIYGIVTAQIEMMPMVRYGFGAWGIITWVLLSGFGLFRDLSYELFVLQHITAAAVFLWALFVHVPSYAAYNIWMSVAFLVFDWGVRVVWATAMNLHLLGRSSDRKPGYSARLEPLPGRVVRVTVENVDFQWKAGQHVYLSVPRLRPFETHPFTIANVQEAAEENRGRLRLLVQARSGFSKVLYNAATKSVNTGHPYRAFLSGPWGTPPDLLHYDTVVLIAASSGASFVLPLLQQITKRRGCVRSACLHWIIRSEENSAWFTSELESLAELEPTQDFHCEILVHVTNTRRPSSAGESKSWENATTVVTSSGIEAGERASLSSADPIHKILESRNGLKLSLNVKYGGRPSLDSMIRPPIEHALGESAVVVCGGVSITAESRTFVAALSDERAVHKGTGAQGIFLFTETYGW